MLEKFISIPGNGTIGDERLKSSRAERMISSNPQSFNQSNELLQFSHLLTVVEQTQDRRHVIVSQHLRARCFFPISDHHLLAQLLICHVHSHRLIFLDHNGFCTLLTVSKTFIDNIMFTLIQVAVADHLLKLDGLHGTFSYPALVGCENGMY